MTQKVETHMNETQDLNRKIPSEKRTNPLFIITRSNVVAWFFSSLIFGGFMFFIGVLVGRDTAPISFDIKKISNIPASIIIEPQINESEKESFQEYSSDILIQLQEDQEDTVISDKNVSNDPLMDGIKTDKEKNLPVKSPQIPGKKNILSSPSLPEQTEKESDVKPANGIRKATHDNIKYIIQVASLNDLAKAANLRDKIIAKGYPAFCRTADIKGTIWHRVRLGPYYDKTVAQNDCLRLKEGGLDTILIEVDKH